MDIWITRLFFLCNCSIRAPMELMDLNVPHVPGWDGGRGPALLPQGPPPALWYSDTLLPEVGHPVLMVLTELNHQWRSAGSAFKLCFLQHSTLNGGKRAL